jgi:predicted metalloprotease with PDZ domain
MLVAFLYDLVIRSDTEGGSSLADSYRSLFTQHANEPANANDVIIKLLTSSPATEGFSATYIESRNRIQLEKILPSFGFEMNTNSSNSHLTVRSGLAEKQKALMRSLGYRN